MKFLIEIKKNYLHLLIISRLFLILDEELTIFK